MPVATKAVIARWRAGLAAGVAVAIMAAGTPSASGAPAPSVVLSFANPSLEMGTPAIAELCGRGAPAGSRAYVQKSKGSGHLWRPVGHAVELVGDQCSTVRLAEPLRGQYLYRGELWTGTTLRYQTPGKRLTVYGPVPFTTWCGNVTGCHLVNGGGGPVRVGGHIDNYFDWVCGTIGSTTTATNTGNYCSSTGAEAFPQRYTLDAANSCRSLTMAIAALAKDNGASGGRITMEVLQHTLGPQTAVPSEGQVLTSRFALDGGPVLIDLTNTGPLSLYLLNASADCYTSSGTTVSPSAPTVALVRVISAPEYELAPVAMAVAGPDVFVANQQDGSSGTVTELDASAGALVRVFSAPAYWFWDPAAIAVAGDDLFVTSVKLVTGTETIKSTITETDASTGKLVRVISAPAYGLNDPDAMAMSGPDLFVANQSGPGTQLGSVTELDASTGALVRVISGSSLELSGPDAMTVAGADLFVANVDGNSVTELDAWTGKLVRVISGPAYGLNQPDAMAMSGADLFVANSKANSVTEVDATTGALVREISAPAYGLDAPEAMTVAGDDLFVASGADCVGNCVTELDASTGGLVRVLSDPAYNFNGPDALAVAGDDLLVGNGDGGTVTELSL